MKKVLASILVAAFVICALSIGVFAVEPVDNVEYGDPDSDPKVIASYTGMDFCNENNLWAQYDEESGTWSSVDSYIIGFKAGEYCDVEDPMIHYVYWDGEEYTFKIIDENDPWYAEARESYDSDEDLVFDKMIDGYENIQETPYMSALFSNYVKHLDWSLSEDGEYITLKVKDGSSVPAIGFQLFSDGPRIELGRETDGKPEYMAIRLRNKSSAGAFQLAWATISTGGGDKLVNRVYTDYNGDDYKSNYGEWVTYIFSVSDANAEMNYENNPGGAWTSRISHLGIFPFGNGKTDGTGAYKGAEMDIDYIVFGSKEFCENYKSKLQEKEESVASIELISAPTKTTYYVGENISLEGLQIRATYTDGSTETITDCNVDYINTEANPSAVVTLKYGTKTTPLTYNVEFIGITKVEIVEAAEKTTFDANELKNGLTDDLIKGLKVRLTYADGATTEETVSVRGEKLSISGLSAGNQVITINYYGTTTSYTVFVTNVESIKIADVDKQVHYGDELTLEDLQITCVYNDEEKTEKSIKDAGLEDYIESIKVDTLKTGASTVTVRIVNSALGIDVSGTGNITVIAPSELVIKTEPTKTTYDPDETIDLSGIELVYKYDDGVEATLNVAVSANKDTISIDGVTVVPDYDFGTPGTAEVKLTVGEYTTSFTATVNEAVATKAPTSTTEPGKKSGCGSAIGIGAVAVIICATGAGVVLCKKKEN